MDHIIAAIRQRIADPKRVTDSRVVKPNPPTTAAKVDVAEAALGFKIPPVLRRLYTEVANGLFGPGYGLAGVDGCGSDEKRNDLVALYRGQLSEDWKKALPHWPDRILRIAPLGCAMYAAVDCKDPAYPVYLFEPNSGDEAAFGHANFLVPHDCGLDDWLLAWANGEDVEIPPSMRDELEQGDAVGPPRA